MKTSTPSSPHARSTLPCFVNGCTYTYRRPDSHVIRHSDRNLNVHHKYDGYVIRSCKRHVDHWLKREDDKTSCEICRGLNKEKVDFNKFYTDRRGLRFFICDVCAVRQAKHLHLTSKKVLNVPPVVRIFPEISKKLSGSFRLKDFPAKILTRCRLLKGPHTHRRSTAVTIEISPAEFSKKARESAFFQDLSDDDKVSSPRKFWESSGKVSASPAIGSEISRNF